MIGDRMTYQGGNEVHARVSVLIPAYRSRAFIGTALDSLRAQTLRDWEAIVSDNASDDGTYEEALRYAAEDPRIRVYRNETNLGPVANWRACARRARADKAALLFSDDWYEPEFLERSLELFEANPSVGFVYSAVRIVRVRAGGSGARATLEYQRPRDGVYGSSEYLRYVYEQRGDTVPVSPGCSVMRTRDLRRWLDLEFANDEAFGYARHGAGPDVALYVQACLEYESFAHIRQPLVCFLAHEANLSWAAGVSDAYAAALYELYLGNRGRMRLDRARVDGVLAYRMRRTALGRRLIRRLGFGGWMHFTAMVRAAVARRLRGWLRARTSARPEGV
jgi:glycosyltransferase involved in cell wall biosynthesis